MALKVILALLSLAGSVFVWWVKNDSEKKRRVSERKKEIEDAVYSGDVSRLHSIIDGLRR
jgi:hypothetical protein